MAIVKTAGGEWTSVDLTHGKLTTTAMAQQLTVLEETTAGKSTGPGVTEREINKAFSPKRSRVGV
jgi:hypothetical protein